MKYTYQNVIGGTYDGSVYCIDCMYDLQIKRSMTAYEPIFSGSEWDHKPTCDNCHIQIDVCTIEEIDNE